ncbi:MAG: phosphodiester glycosidase family protein [Clostridia bacterium]|nr:phosphodiester glycosidase family protein [Clostridia bacterium]
MAGMTLEERIEELAEQERLLQAERKQRRRRTPRWLPAVLDIAVAGVLLCTFALFHHVIPFSADITEPIVPPVTDDQPVTPEENSIKAPFTAEVVKTETSYSSPNIAITVEKCTKGEGNTLVTYYVADVRLNNIECFRTAFAKDKFGKNIKEDVLPLAERHGAILATAGDYYGMNATRTVIRNGTLYRQSNLDGDVCVLYRDGSMKIFYDREPFDAAAEMENGAWQAWSFGPSLFKKDGSPITSYGGYLAKAHPRCAIGYYEPGHYAFVVVDGRADGYSQGLTMVEFANLMKELGCAAAYNLDGGQTAQMAFDGAMVNQPYQGGRVVSDILYIGEVE